MPIARLYTPLDILNLLQAAEGQRRVPSAAPAHTLGTHLNITKQGLETRILDDVMEQATKFASSEDMVGCVYEAMNSASGQMELVKLDNGSQPRVIITHTPKGSYDAEGELGEIFVFPMLANATEKKAMRVGGSIGSMGTRKIRVVKVIVDKQDANTPWIQTAYPAEVV
jgi:hypothetical protein